MNGINMASRKMRKYKLILLKYFYLVILRGKMFYYKYFYTTSKVSVDILIYLYKSLTVKYLVPAVLILFSQPPSPRHTGINRNSKVVVDSPITPSQCLQ